MRYARSAKAAWALGATLIAGMHLTIANAETGSAVNGITQGGVNGITQGGVTGITQGGIQGITQGGIYGITQGGIQGITQGGVTGITQGGIQGITQGGVTGITQGGIQGITQGGVTGITQGGVNGITQGGINSFDSLVLAGPVDSIDSVNGVFTAVGQTVMASQDMLASIKVGDYVSVNGSVVTSGWLYADAISISNLVYVPGATPVIVTGILSANDPARGQARLGALTIDYTAAMSGGAIPSELSLSFSGIQPNSRGMLVSDAVSAVQ